MFTDHASYLNHIKNLDMAFQTISDIIQNGKNTNLYDAEKLHNMLYDILYLSHTMKQNITNSLSSNRKVGY